MAQRAWRSDLKTSYPCGRRTYCGAVIDAPAVRFAASPDGTSIAYWAIGEGRPLVYLPPMPFTHVEREWAIPELQRRYRRLAADRRIVRYDARGFGLSDRSPVRAELDAHVEDLAAVLDQLEIRECDLYAYGDAGMVAIKFSASHPDRVGRLILWGAWARREAVRSDPKIQSLRALWDQDWNSYTELAASSILGWEHRDQAAVLAQFYRDAAAKESINTVIMALEADDVSAELRDVAAETLVVGLDQPAVADLTAESRRIAALIPNAEMRIVPGVSAFFDLFDEEDHVVRVVGEFLADSASPAAGETVERVGSADGSNLRVVLFTDVVNHTAMMQRLGDAAGRALLRRHEEATRSALAHHGGVEVKTLGDGFMATFGSASRAVECAIELQQQLEEVFDTTEPVRVRIGLNAGEPIEDGGDLFGATVILAARIAAHAEGGEILIPESVRGLLAGKRYKFTDRGEFAPKGFDEPVRVFGVTN